MENTYRDKDRLEVAKKKVKAIKGFYRHLRTFITVTLILAVLYVVQTEPIIRLREAINEEILHWIDLNILVNLGIWAIILLIHGIVVYNFRFSFIKEWEDRQIQKYLNEE